MRELLGDLGELTGVWTGAGEATVVFRLQRLERLLGRVVRRRVRHPEEIVGDGDVVHAWQILGPTDELFQSLELLFIQKPVCVNRQRVGCLICLKRTKIKSETVYSLIRFYRPHFSYRVISQKVFFEPLQDTFGRLIGEYAFVEIGALPAGRLIVVVRVERNFPES